MFACELIKCHLICRQLKDVEKRMEQVHAAVVHLDSQLQLVASVDFGFTLGTAIVLPILQARSADGARCTCAASVQHTRALINRHNLLATGC